MAEFSVTRTHSTWKPRVTDKAVPYFHCKKCGAILSGIDGDCKADWKNDGERSLIAQLPYSLVDFKPSCCGEPMERLEMIQSNDIEDKIKIDYQIVGGMNNNAVNITWNVKDSACEPRWFALKTFTGVMMKYVLPKKWPPIVFALADEDAFAYCDKNPCVECTFRCKRGMEVYAYVENIGLVVMPLERMTPPGSGKADFKKITDYKN